MEDNRYLTKLIEALKGIEELDLFAGKAELSGTEFRLLREVLSEREQGKDIISSELARRLGITRSAVSQIVTKLESKNIVKRTASKTDKKIAYIRLSQDASRIFEEQRKRANEYLGRIVDAFGEKRMEHFVSECEALHETVRKVRSEYCGE